MEVEQKIRALIDNEPHFDDQRRKGGLATDAVNRTVYKEYALTRKCPFP